ncbi:mechanosensitive ion channel family protein [Candidatus Woesearchaeota archaeon]|jgi:small-conductance mechanosensitive channel|nr:mechanosensitive ion channel family protein [Candidatus Woesearchaeota archaeon]MBT5397354.1 mechanosensitive ion channel family protein [Candidatus Woesearchaeota archaeon]MBT5924549.1 mechanosensitive ion channel family protein [Candidatus Woesearchaeota archaeon]MBT6367801.1 mechanosensitive ion channel family protein [Candidatus Woesearchaeota archaeon]MBT7762754.1 mechanosensitive ion channel family protein [Candidatus Woesearchaeota archaeon]
MKQYIVDLLGTLPYGTYLQNQYVLSGIIIVISILAAWLLLFIFSRFLEKFAKNTKTKVDDLIFDRTKKPLFYLILAYGFKLAILNLGFNGVVSKTVNTVMALVFVLIIIRAIDIIIDAWGMTFAKKTQTKLDDILLPLFHKATRVVFVLIALMWILDIWEVNIAPYLAGVGISGIVLGLALQDSLKNILGGVTLLLDKTYQVGDKIKLESGNVGTVLDIGLRSTKMQTYDNEVIYIPNGYLANSSIQNYTRPTPIVRAKVEFGVEYGSNVDTVKKVVLTVIKKLGVLSDPAPDVQFLSMGDSALQFKALFWVERWDEAYGKKLEATQKIYEALRKENIGIPFPTQTIYLKKDGNN